MEEANKLVEREQLRFFQSVACYDRMRRTYEEILFAFNIIIGNTRTLRSGRTHIMKDLEEIAYRV
jgi:hypothetical protein